MMALENEIYLYSLKKALRKTKNSTAKVLNDNNWSNKDYFQDFGNTDDIGSTRKAKSTLKRNLKIVKENQKFRDLGLDMNGESQKPSDWYLNLETNEVEWFDGGYQIEGYEKLGFDYIESSTDVNSVRTQLKYDGATKSSYNYDFETAKFQFLKNYDNDPNIIDNITPFVNAPIIVIDQFSGALVNGFQMSGIALYEGIVNGRELDGLKFNSLGYEPALDMESTKIFNNGKWVKVNVHAQGTQEFAKIYSSNLLRITPFKANLLKNKWLDKLISSRMKKELREFIEGQ